MVAPSVAALANKTALLSSLPSGYTAVFIGATSGIGLSALKQLAVVSRGKAPVVYIVGRSANAATPLLAELRQTNPSAKIVFIEQDVSLVKNIEAVVDEIKKHEDKIDLLFMSAGFISFEGRIETSEGLDPTMTTRFYSRARAIQLLLPLLNNSANPHVTNILGGGQEGALKENDLDLAQPGNYSIPGAAGHSATMLTLVLERFAVENPKISFVHAFPGLTATPTLTRGSSGILGFLLRWIVAPLVKTLISSKVDDVGAKALFYATNARYTVQQTADLAAPVPEGLSKAGQTVKGVFLVGADGETADNEKVLSDLRNRVADKTWTHALDIFDRVSRR